MNLPELFTLTHGPDYTIEQLVDVFDRVRTQPDLQPRAKMNSKHLAYLNTVLDTQGRFADPLDGVMSPLAPNLIYIFSGFHRFEVCRVRGKKRLGDVMIRLFLPRNGRTAERDAFIRSLTPPATGFGCTPETKADKRHRIMLALADPELSMMKNQLLAKFLGVGTETITYHRKLLKMAAPPPAPATEPSPIEEIILGALRIEPCTVNMLCTRLPQFSRQEVRSTVDHLKDDGKLIRRSDRLHVV